MAATGTEQGVRGADAVEAGFDFAFDCSVPEGSAGELLDAVARWTHTRRELSTKVLRAAVLFCDMHSGDAVASASGQVLPGVEQAKRLGGAGTPAVAEFAAAMLAVRLGVSTFSARRLMADGLDIRHRLPLLWARVCAGEVEDWVARKVAQATRHLDEAAAGFVDTAVAPFADGRLSWGRFLTLLDGKVVAADPVTAEQRERRAAEDRFVRLGRANEHGIKTMYVRGLGRDLVFFDAMVAQVADALAWFGDTDRVDLRRARAVGILANPLLAAKLLIGYAQARGTSTGGGADGGLLDFPADPATGPGEEPETGPRVEPDPVLDLHPCEDEQTPPPPADPRDRDDDGCAGDGEAADLGPASCPACLGSGRVSGDAAAFTRPVLDLDQVKIADLLPKATLYLHLAGDTVVRDQHGVARWDGEGPVTAQHVKDFLGPWCRFSIKPVIDLENLTPVDAYESAKHKEAVHLRSPADFFPWSANLDRD
ncbi:MAG TPA: hypothetical protein VLA97_02760, partial [Nocardioidaceae bacterium]|nr:hypothetical protein [Nocardioidaceae bacterium]